MNYNFQQNNKTLKNPLICDTKLSWQISAGIFAQSWQKS